MCGSKIAIFKIVSGWGVAIDSTTNRLDWWWGVPHFDALPTPPPPPPPPMHLILE